MGGNISKIMKIAAIGPNDFRLGISLNNLNSSEINSQLPVILRTVRP
jgi:hypothetical protein